MASPGVWGSQSWLGRSDLRHYPVLYLRHHHLRMTPKGRQSSPGTQGGAGMRDQGWRALRCGHIQALIGWTC